MSKLWIPQEEKVIRNWIFQSLYHHDGTLTDWERRFLIDIDKWYNISLKLSKRQEETLEKIYAKRTN